MQSRRPRGSSVDYGKTSASVQLLQNESSRARLRATALSRKGKGALHGTGFGCVDRGLTVTGEDRTKAVPEETPAFGASLPRVVGPVIALNRQSRRRKCDGVQDFFQIGTQMETPGVGRYELPVYKDQRGNSFAHGSSRVTADVAIQRLINRSKGGKSARPMSAPFARRDFVAENVAAACVYKDFKASSQAATNAVAKDRRENVKDRFRRKDEVVVRNKLLLAKKELIKEAEERKYVYIQELKARQQLWLRMLTQHQLTTVGIRTLREDRKQADKRTQTMHARRVIARTVRSSMFRRGVGRHVHAITIVRRAARKWSIHRIVKRKRAAAALVLGFLADRMASRHLRAKLVAFKHSVCTLQNWWRRSLSLICSRNILVDMQFAKFESGVRSQLRAQREELEMQMIDQHKRPYAYDDGGRVHNEELPEMPPCITPALKKEMLYQSVKARLAKFNEEMREYEEWVVNSWYHAREAAGIHVRGPRKTYKQVVQLQVRDLANGDTGPPPVGQARKKPVCAYLASQEELATMYAGAIERETTYRRQRHHSLQEKNRAFGEERDYSSFSWSSRERAKGARNEAEHQHEMKNKPLPPSKSVVEEKKPTWRPPGIKPKVTVRVQKSPRSYYKEFGTLFGRDD